VVRGPQHALVSGRVPARSRSSSARAGRMRSSRPAGLALLAGLRSRSPTTGSDRRPFQASVARGRSIPGCRPGDVSSELKSAWRAPPHREYATRELSLPDNASLYRPSDLGRRFALYNVFARRSSRSSEGRVLPITGCVAYAASSRRRTRCAIRKLRAEGYDVLMSAASRLLDARWSTTSALDLHPLPMRCRWRGWSRFAHDYHDLSQRVYAIWSTKQCSALDSEGSAAGKLAPSRPRLAAPKRESAALAVQGDARAPERHLRDASLPIDRLEQRRASSTAARRLPRHRAGGAE